MRIMFDAVTPANIPANADAVAGYINGSYTWKPQDWARLPTPLKLTIAVNVSADAHCLDVERGDATPAQAPAWAQRQRQRGNPFPWVYCSESVWDECRREFSVQGVPQPLWWIAAYPGPGQVLYPGAIAHQFSGDGIYDRSVLADNIPGFDNAGGPEVLDPNDPIVTELRNRLKNVEAAIAPYFGDTNSHLDRVGADIKAAIQAAPPGAPGALSDADASKVADLVIARLKAHPLIPS